MLKAHSKEKETLYLAGPTGVGKSAFAIELALQLGGEIIGADAFQIYRGFPILTAQPSQEQQAVVPHHLIGTLSLTQSCDAGRYRSMALPLLEEIKARQRWPLVTGGTGFYIRSLIEPLDPLPTADPALRAELSVQSLEELIARLEQLDSEAITQIDLKNRRRVERTIEIITQSGLPLVQLWQQKKNSAPRAMGFFLFRDREELYQRIEAHVQNMFERGVIEEIEALDAITMSPTAAMALGLRDIQAMCRGEQSLSKTIEAITRATKRYAKRQLTWFKNQHSFIPVNLSRFSSLQAAAEEVVALLKSFSCEAASRYPFNPSTFQQLL